MILKQITLNDALPIRHKVLWPDKPVDFCRVEGDDDAVHYGAFVNNRLVCTASLYPDNPEPNQARLRKFATLPEYQGQGIGSRMIAHLIEKLKSMGMTYLWFDARVTAIDFYKRFGFFVISDPFDKSGLPYVKMGMSFLL